MVNGNLDDLAALLAVARVRSFTRAAAELGVSQSALSQTTRGLEARLGLRLLTRTNPKRRHHRSGRAFAPQHRAEDR